MRFWTKKERELESGKISVIIPTWNRADLLPRAIESVLRQTREADEIIVVDDGSTDETAAAMRPFEARGIRYLRKENGGASSARNLGIESAKGEFLAFLDSDDEYRPELLAETMAMLEKHPSAGVAYTDAAWVCEGEVVEEAMNWGPRKTAVGELLKIERGWSGCFDRKRFRYAQLHFSLVQMSAVLVRAEVFEKVGAFCSRYDPAEDYEFWLRVSRYYDFCYVDAPLGAIYVHGTNLTVRPELRERFRQSNRMAMKSELAWETDEEMRRVIVERLLQNWETSIAIRLGEGDRNQLRRELTEARADGWRSGEQSMRRIKMVDRYGAMAGVAFNRALSLIGR
jgi:glycosyltransferase involved in cell wall biosynthesis